MGKPSTIWLAPPNEGRSRRHRGACLYVDGVRHGVPDYVYTLIVESNALSSLSTSLWRFLVQSMTTSFPRQVMESNASSFLCRPEVDALDSHEHVGQTCERAIDCSGSHVKRASTTSATIHEVRVLPFPREKVLTLTAGADRRRQGMMSAGEVHDPCGFAVEDLALRSFTSRSPWLSDGRPALQASTLVSSLCAPHTLLGFSCHTQITSMMCWDTNFLEQ